MADKKKMERGSQLEMKTTGKKIWYVVQVKCQKEKGETKSICSFKHHKRRYVFAFTYMYLNVN